MDGLMLLVGLFFRLAWMSNVAGTVPGVKGTVPSPLITKHSPSPFPHRIDQIDF